MNSIMKHKQFIGIMVMALLLASGGHFIAHADDNGKFGGFSGPSAKQGGFSGPGPQVITIMEAPKQADDTWITLQGNIIQHVGDDKYTFKDASGQGIVEIDHDKWGGQHISPTDIVVLITKVDKDWGAVELEVESVRKAQ